MKTSRADVTRGSGNVFADLGFDNPDDEVLKAQLSIRIRALIAERGLTQAAAGRILSIAQPDVSAIVNGRVAGFSLERLFGFIRRLGDDIEITIRHSKAKDPTGRVSVKMG
jgi:predicted XRE-type DNA-binding protein